MTNFVAQQLATVPMVLPPGTQQFTTVIAWVTGIAGVVLIVSWIFAVGSTGLQALSHGQMTGGKAMLVTLFCGVLLGATSAIFTTLNIVVG